MRAPQDRPQASRRRRRRSFPIHAYTGPNGGGKTVMAVYDTIPSLLAKRPVLSTVRLLDFENPGPCPGGIACDAPNDHYLRASNWIMETDDEGRQALRHETFFTGEVHRKAHPYFVPFTNLAQLLTWRDGDVLMDEVTGVASSRESTNLPPEISNLLVQLRRRNISVRITTPALSRTDKILREVLQVVTVCTSTIPGRMTIPPGSAIPVWGQKRLMIARTYDALLLDDFENGVLNSAAVSPLFTQWLWRPAGLVNSAYDTFADVLSPSIVSDAGACLSCGGARKRRPCSCPADHGKRGTEVAQPEDPSADSSGLPSFDIQDALSFLATGRSL